MGMFCKGAHHANEQPFVFHVLSETVEELKEDGGKYCINASNPLEIALSTQTVNFFATMAGTGNPGAAWPLYDVAKQTAMIFGDASAAAPAQPLAGPRKAKCDFWDEQFKKVLATPSSALSASSASALNNKHQAMKALQAGKYFRGF